MATTPTTPPSASFLGLPPSIRQIICTHLLAPHPSEDVTTINYTLTWTYLENPSNTTFAGIQQIDLCRCPQQSPHTSSSPTEDHIYTRYKCAGPDITFKGGKEDLWVLSPAYIESGQINFLRPAERWEVEGRPCGNVLSTCRAVYEEALPILYRGRNFLFLTGPCPRGRYQAYATQTFLERLNPLARSHVTAVSLIAQSYEEDCSVNDVGRAYADLVRYLGQSVPGFTTLCLNVWDERLVGAARECRRILETGAIEICLVRDPRGGMAVTCGDVEGFLEALEGGDVEGFLEALEGGERAANQENWMDRGDTTRPWKSVRHEKTVWEEVDAEEDIPEYENQAVRTAHGGLKAQKEPGKRRPSKSQRVSPKSVVKGKRKVRQEAQGEEEDEWIDAALSPDSIHSRKDGETGSWEVL